MQNEDEERAARAWTNVIRDSLRKLKESGMSDEECMALAERTCRQEAKKQEALIRAKYPHLLKYLDD